MPTTWRVVRPSGSEKWCRVTLAHGIACGQIDYGNVVSPLSAAMATGMPQADGSDRPEPRMGTDDAADAVFYMAQLPLSANVLNMTVMATNMPLVGRG